MEKSCKVMHWNQRVKNLMSLFEKVIFNQEERYIQLTGTCAAPQPELVSKEGTNVQLCFQT